MEVARGTAVARGLLTRLTAELEPLAQSLSERVGWHLERRGLQVRDAENDYLAAEPEGEDGIETVPESTAARALFEESDVSLWPVASLDAPDPLIAGTWLRPVGELDTCRVVPGRG